MDTNRENEQGFRFHPYSTAVLGIWTLGVIILFTYYFLRGFV
jgi:hypothetical protein